MSNKTITLHDKTHAEHPFPDVQGHVDCVGDEFRLYLRKFWNDIPPEYRERTEAGAMLRVDEWIAWMNQEYGYTIQSVKDNPETKAEREAASIAERGKRADMNCPYCQKPIFGLTGFLEAEAFQRHLPKCRRNPNNLHWGRKVAPAKPQTILDALEMKTTGIQTKHTLPPWGIEQTEHTSWIGPMRADGEKVNEIVFLMDRDQSLKDAVRAKVDANAAFIVTAVNSYTALRSALGVVLDQVDYTKGACDVTEMVGAILPKEVITLAREALAMAGKEAA